MKKTIFNRAILCLAATLILTSSQAQKKEQTAEKNPTKSEVTIKTDGSAITDGNIVDYKDGDHTYSFRITGDKINDLYVDGKKIPDSEYPKYKSAINKILLQIKKDKEQAQLDMMKAQQDQKQAKMDMEEAQLSKQKAEQDMLMAKMEKQNVEQDRLRAMKDQERASLDKSKAEEDRKLLNSLLNEIVSEKIVSNEDDISSITLNSTAFIVNGKKQSSSMHQKFKTKYLKDANSELNYHNSNNGRQFNIQKKGD
jgi:hypothetical protein